jgi:hypothetical protein
LRRGGVTEPKAQHDLIEKAKKSGWSAAMWAPINVVAATATSMSIWMSLNPQTFNERVVDAAISGSPALLVGAALGVGQSLYNDYRDAREASREQAAHRAAGRDPDVDPVTKFKEHDDTLSEHGQSISSLTRSHRSLLSITTRAVRKITDRLTGAEQRLTAMRSEVDAVKTQSATDIAALRQEFQGALAAQQQHYEGRMAQKDRQNEERLGAQERRIRSEVDARISGVNSRLDTSEHRLDGHDEGFRLTHSSLQNGSARMDSLEQNQRQPQPDSLPPGEATRGQDLLDRARRFRDETRATPNPSTGSSPRPGQPFNQPPASPPRPHGPRQ